MRFGHVFRCSALFVLFLSSTVYLSLFKPTGNVLKGSSLFIIGGGDIKSFPGRNSGLPRRSRVTAMVAPSLKFKAGMELVKILFCASYMVLLAGDISTNPGPQQVTDMCVLCKKGCRSNQRAIQCNECDKWFHAKCISMNVKEFNNLANLTANSSCNKCLFPGLFHPNLNESVSSNAF
jgi:hypothetical protein